MSDREGRQARTFSSTSGDRWRLHNQPAFWVVAAAVFLGNAIVSAAAGERLMVALQTVTGLLALLAAATAAARPNN